MIILAPTQLKRQTNRELKGFSHLLLCKHLTCSLTVPVCVLALSLVYSYMKLNLIIVL